MQQLLLNFIKDIRIESVKFTLQTSVPHDDIQYNDLMGTFDHTTLDGGTISEILGTELRKVEELVTAYDPIPLLLIIVKYWNDTRIEIQYHGYYSSTDRSEAYCYVLLQRILKRKHKELYKLVRKRLTLG